MATADDYAHWIVANADKKGTPEFETVSAAYQHAKQEAAPPAPDFDPSEGGGTLSLGPWDTGIKTPQWLDRTLAGAGKAVADTGLGIKQLASQVGIGDRDKTQMEVDASKVRDGPLMNTAGGIVGNILGQVGMAVGPGAAVGAVGKAAQLPRLAAAAQGFMAPTRLGSAAASGAIQAGAQPVGTGDSRLVNAAEGGAVGAALPAAMTAGNVVKTILSPLFKGGQEQVAGRALERFATDPNAIKNLNPQTLVPGSMPTLAEATGDIGLSQLQRSLRNNPDANAPITERLLSNQAARQKAIDGIAGDPGQRDFYAASRGAAAKDLYGKAFDETPTLTPWVKGEINKLQQRPSFQAAWPQAESLAAEEGVMLTPDNVVQVSHYTKMALDDMIDAAQRAGQGHQQRALSGTRDKLVSLMESKDFAPAYREARATYAEMSKPINQMDIGQLLSDRMRPALAEFGATGRVNAAQYAQAVRDSGGTASRATGFPGATLENTLTPEQLSTVTNVAKDLGRSANAAELGMAKGSPTTQNNVGQDILRQTLGPLGLPKGLLDSALADTAMRPIAWAFRPAEKRILGMLGDAVTDPAEAKRLVALAKKDPGAFTRAMQAATPYVARASTAGMLGLSQ